MSIGTNFKHSIKKQGNSKKNNKAAKIIKKMKEFFVQGKVFPSLTKQAYNFQISTYFLLVCAAIAHTIAVQTRFSQRQNETFIENFFQFMGAENWIYELVFCLLILTKIILLTSVSVEVILRLEIFGLSWLARMVVEYSRIIIELDLALSALMATVDLMQNLPILLFSGLLSIMHTLYLQNYLVRKDHMYVSSSYHFLIFRLLIFFIYTLNAILLVFATDFAFYIFHGCLGTFHIIWFLRKGHMLFIHKNPHNFLLIVSALFFTVDVLLMQKLVIDNRLVDSSQIVKAFLIFSIILFSLYSKIVPNLSKLQTEGCWPSKETDILLNLLQQTFDSNEQAASELIGLLQISINDDLTKREKIYDPSWKIYVKREDLFVQKQTAVLFFIKRLYQNQYEEGNNIGQTCIDFCEFLCNEHTDYCLALKYLQQAKLRPLSFLQRLRVSALQLLIENQNEKINSALYDGALELQHVIETEDCFSLIEEGILQYIRQNLRIWKTIGEQSIDQTLLRTAIKRVHATFNEIEELWREIAKFMPTNKHWRFIYALYQLLIKNQRVKQKEFEVDGKKQNENFQNFSQSIIYFEQKQKEERLIDPAILFNNDSGCITAVLKGTDLIIRRVNQRFTRITGYQEEQITGCQVEVLMPSDLSSIHAHKFRTWLQEGYVSNELSYQVHFTSLLSKYKEIIPAVKYFKAHYHPDVGLEFVCLLKANKKPELKYSISGRIQTVNGECFSSIENYSLKLRDEILTQNAERSLIDASIFFKEEFLLPNQTFKQIRYFGIISRIFTVTILISIIVLSQVILTNSYSLNDYSSEFMTLMSMYISPIVLTTDYMKKFINITGAAKNDLQIQTTTATFLSLSALQSTKMNLFDDTLNRETTYYPYYNYTFLINDSLNSIDLYNTLVSAASSLNTVYINSSSQDFKRLNSYIKPAYDTMMNTTKFNIHQAFRTILMSSISIQAGFILAQTAVFIIILGLLLYLIRTFCKKMQEIELILFNFSGNQIQAVQKYWKAVRYRFNTLLICSDDSRSERRRATKIVQNEQESLKEPEAAINKRSKDTSQNKQRRKIETILQLLVIFALLAVVGLSVFTELSMMNQFYELLQFQNAGFYFLKYFPSSHQIVMGCIERYYHQSYPSEVKFNPRRYDDVLWATQKFSFNYSYIGSVVDPTSSYYLKQKNYFFGSPCEYNPSILLGLNFTVRKCLKEFNGTFRQGLSSYLRFAHTLGQKCINKEVQLNSHDLSDFSAGPIIFGAYLLDAMATWASQFTTKVQSVQAVNLNVCLIIIGVGIVIHIILNQFVILQKLRQDYDFVKTIYMNMVPEFILIKEKVIRQKFVIEGIIKT